MLNFHAPSAPQNQDPVARLVFQLSKLPGIGEKTATRLAYYILKQDAAYARALAECLISAKEKIGLCASCFTFTDMEICRICTNHERDHSIVCVVEKPSDVFSMEQAGAHRGIYHVLHGALSPLDGVGPEELKIRELLTRVYNASNTQHEHLTTPVREVILATNPSVEGEATALYLARLLKPFGVRITQLAHGLPMGGTLEYTDRQTIGKAMENRVEMS